MIDVPVGIELRPVVIPEVAGAVDTDDFARMVRVRNAVTRALKGHDDDSLTPAELLPHLQGRAYERNLVWLALLDGDVVGRALLTLPLEPGSRVAFLDILVHPDAWGRGVGSAALGLLQRSAREYGRTVLQGWGLHPGDGQDGERVTAPTGFGAVPLDHTARFLLQRGYALEQVDRNSALPLTAQAYTLVDDLFAEAERTATGYRIVQWTAPTPAEFVAGYALMKARMVTDAPAAAIEFDEEAWDAERLADHERPYLVSGRTLFVTAAQHVATGELVAFNELVIGADRTAATHQEDTLVVAAHRGHRLGILVKCAALRSWRALAPDSPRVITYNAEENRPMLDINERLGFVPIAYEGGWKKTVA